MIPKSYDCKYCGRYVCWKIEYCNPAQAARMQIEQVCQVCMHWIELMNRPNVLVDDQTYAAYVLSDESDSHLWVRKFKRLTEGSKQESAPLWYRGDIPEKLRPLCQPTIRIVR